MNKFTMEDRIKVARNAVLMVREKSPMSRFGSYRSVIASTPKEWAIGVIGVLDFVETGDPQKIMISDVRAEVERIIKESETAKSLVSNK